MLSSVNSPQPKPTLCRNNSSTCNDSISVVIKEIQSSLFLATSIIEDDTHDDYSSIIDGHHCENTVHFECGRLKHSRVKGEWSILHRPICTCDDDILKSSTYKNSVAMVIASIWPLSVPNQNVTHSGRRTKKNNRSIYKKISTKKLKMRQNNKMRRKLPNEDCVSYDVGDNFFDSVNNDETDHKMAQPTTKESLLQSSRAKVQSEGKLTLPPIELVRCLLNGAEFISMMNYARREVETSIQKRADDDNVNSKRMNTSTENSHDEKTFLFSKAQVWSRRVTKNLKQRSINLQPMIVALVAAVIGANSQLYIAETNGSNIDTSSLEIITLRFIDECIRFAHLYTLDYISRWSSCWQIRTNLRSEKVENIEDENPSLSIAGTKSPTKSRVMSTFDQNGKDRNCDQKYKIKKEYLASNLLGAMTTIKDFVRECLAQPWDDMSTMGSTETPFNNYYTNKKYSNDNHHQHHSKLLKRYKVSHRSKVFRYEPADSLATTCTKPYQSTNLSGTKHQLTSMKNDPLLEKQRQRRVKHNLHVYAPSLSVLENTTTTILQGKGRPTRTTRNDSASKRKWSDSLSEQTKRTRQNAREKKVLNKEHDTYIVGYHNICEVGSDEEKASHNSLYEFFDKNQDEIEREIICMNSRDNEGGPRSLGTTRPGEGRLKSSFMCFEARVGKDDSICVGEEIGNEKKCRQNEQQLNKPVLALHNCSETLRAVPTTHRYLSTLSCDKNNSNETTNPSSDNNSVKTDIVDRKALVNKQHNPITDNLRKLGFIKVKECVKVTKGCCHTGPIKVEKETTDHVTTNDAEESVQALQSKDKCDKKHDNDELVDRSSDSWLNPKNNSFDKNGNADDLHTKADWSAIQGASSLPWVTLSHIGHISDYHGYKRRYEHFAPLQFGAIEDIQSQVGKTLVENKYGIDEESDEEDIQDNKDYERAIQQYESLAEKERSLKTKSKIHWKFSDPQKPKNDNMGDMMVLFSPPEVSNLFGSPTAKATTTKYFTETLYFDESSTLQPEINFRIFDEDCILFNADEDSGNNKHKRKSRSAQILLQKKTSIRILSEMLHTLDFIEKYNRTSRELQDMEEVKKQVVKEDANDISNDEDPSDNKCYQRKMNFKQSSREVQVGRRTSLANNKLPIKAKPPVVTLTTVSLLQAYKVLRKRFSSFYLLRGKGNIDAIKREIQSILNKDSLLDEFFRDNDIITEEKNIARCIRRYSSKADQEKIEKRNFEEQQKLRQHEFEYYRLRRKKKSAQEIEWKVMSSRPIYYVRNGASLLTRTGICNFKPNCTICKPMLDSKCCDNTIFFPKFRREEDDKYISPCTERDDGQSEIRSSNFVHPSKVQKLASSLELLELYHTLDFIENYNNGLIVSGKRRK